MSFAIVELKYMERKYFIVRIESIKDYNPKKSSIESFFCYISTDLSEDANFEAAYYQKFVGESGLFKVFVRKVTDTLEEAILWQKNKRMNSVPNKLRAPTNTDIELNTQLKIRKKNEKKIQQSNKINANIQNMSHLVKLVKEQNVPATSLEYKKSQPVSDKDTTLTIGSCEDNQENSVLDGVADFEKTKNETTPNSTTIILTSSLAANNNRKKQTESIVINGSDENGNLLLTKRPKEQIQQNLNVAMDTTKTLQLLTSDRKKAPNRVRAVVNVRKQGQNRNNVATTSKEAQAKSSSLGVAKKILSSSSAPLNVVQKLPPQIESVSKQQVQNVQNVMAAAKLTHAKIPLTCLAKSSNVAAKNSLKRLAITSESNNDITKIRKTVPDPITTNTELDKIRQLEASIKKLQGENLQLKSNNQILTEQNNALQTALVICTKAIPKELSFEETDGGRLYNCGVFLNQVQCEVLDSIVDDREYCNALVTAVFGSDTLKKSSVKGSVSNRTKAPAKDQLDPKELKFGYDIMAIRTRNSVDFTTTKINKMINKKISNLLASERGPRPSKKKLTDATATEHDKNIDTNSDETYEEEVNVLNDVGNVGDPCSQFDIEMIQEHDAQWTYDANSYYLINVPNANDFSD